MWSKAFGRFEWNIAKKSSIKNKLWSISQYHFVFICLDVLHFPKYISVKKMKWNLLHSSFVFLLNVFHFPQINNPFFHLFIKFPQMRNQIIQEKMKKWTLNWISHSSSRSITPFSCFSLITIILHHSRYANFFGGFVNAFSSRF
jgi:hypothetical protein